MADYGQLSAGEITTYLSRQALSKRSPTFSLWIAGIGDPDDYVLQISTNQGIESARGRGKIKVGTAIIRASNQSNLFFSDGKSTLKDNAQMKIWMGFGNLNIPVFTGVIKNVEPILKSNEVEITCTDYMGVLLQSTISGHQGITNTPKLLLESFATDVGALSNISSADEFTTAYDRPEFDTIFKLTALEKISDSVFSVPLFDNNGVLQFYEREYQNLETWVFEDKNTFDCLILANSEIINRVDTEYWENFIIRNEIQQSIDDYRLRAQDLRLPILNSDLVDSYITGSTNEELDNDIEGVKFTSASGTTTIDCIAVRIKQSSASGYTTAKIYSDNAGTPNALLGTSRQKASGGFSTSYAWEYFYFDTPIDITESTAYWLMIDTTSVTGDLYWQRSANPDLSGDHWYYNNPASALTNVGDIDDGGEAYIVWGDGTYIYLANQNDGLRAYTFDGTTLTNVGDIDDGGQGWSVWGDGTHIYLANRADGLRAYTFDGATFTNVGHIDDVGTSAGVWGDGTYIYVAYLTSGIAAYSFDGATFTNIDTIDDGGSALTIWGDGTYIYVANSGDGLRAYTFNGTTFTNVGSIDDGGFANGVWGDGTYIYLANQSDGLRAYTFNGTIFTNVGHVDVDSPASALHVWGDGTYIYLGNFQDGLRAYTFDGTTFTNVGTIDDDGEAKGVWGDGTYIYLANDADGLRAYTIDISSLENEKKCKFKIRGSRPAQRISEDIVRFYREPKKRIQIFAPGAPHLERFDEILVDLKEPFEITGRFVIENRRLIITPREFLSIYSLQEAN